MECCGNPDGLPHPCFELPPPQTRFFALFFQLHGHVQSTFDINGIPCKPRCAECVDTNDGIDDELNEEEEDGLGLVSAAMYGDAVAPGKVT